MPIVKVPTNIVMETGHLIGGLPYGSIIAGRELYKVLRDPAYEIPPEVADKIMYNIKKGSVGVGMMALGYLNPQIFGGYYQKGEKRKKGDVPVGGMKIGDFEVPKWLLHNPFLEAIQFGATMRRVHDDLNSKRLIEENALHDAPRMVTNAAKGVIEQVPFYDEPIRAVEAAMGNNWQVWASELGESMLMPQVLRDAAKDLDRSEGDYVKRAKYTFGDYLQSDVPFLRNKLPEKGDRFVTVDGKHYNALGEEVTNVDTSVGTAINPIPRPIPITIGPDEATWKFIKDNDINVLPPQQDAEAMKFISDKGEKVQELTDTQYASFVKARGDVIKKGLDVLIPALSDLNKEDAISQLMDGELDNGNKVFSTKEKAEQAYDFLLKSDIKKITSKILSAGTDAGLYEVGAYIRVPKDIKLELAKIIFGEEEKPKPTIENYNNK